MKKVILLFVAIFCLSSAITYAGDREAAKILLNSAEKSLKEADYTTAQSMCERALAEDKDYPKAHYVMGEVLEAQGKAKDAIAAYQLAADLAKKEKDSLTESQALTAAKKLGPGLLEIRQLDQKLSDKMMTLGNGAAAEGQLDTAKAAYEKVLALNPNNEDAKKRLNDVQQKIDARGDPIRAMTAAAGMSEVWYKVGIGNKDDARKLAEEISSKYADMPYGKDAQKLVDCNFDLSKTIKNDIAEAKQQLKEVAAIKKALPSTPTTSNTSSVRPAQGGVDIDAVEAAATIDAKALPKDKLIPTFMDTFKKGKDFYSKATPGSEGNQKNVASALEQFIRCEALYMRIDDQKMMTPDVEASEKDASMLRYACMKMTILSH